MRTFIHIACWLALTVAILYVTIGAEDGVFFHNPIAVVGLGLIGAGLCIDARRGESGLLPSAEEDLND